LEIDLLYIRKIKKNFMLVPKFFLGTCEGKIIKNVIIEKQEDRFK